MAIAIHFDQPGMPSVLRAKPVNEQMPGDGQVWLKQEAIGVNYLDVTQRNGAVRINLPSGLGLEGAGVVAAIGAKVTNVRPGDRVAYATGPLGGYTTARLYPAERLIKLPEGITFEQAAASIFKGITAQYLLKSTYPVGPGTIMLLYGVAGGLGQIMGQWAKYLGAFVIGVVSRPESIERAKSVGCDEVLVFDPATLAKEVAKVTQGRMVDVVYDPIGAISFEASLDSLRPRGLLVSFGASSGAPTPVELSTLNAKGSLFLTRLSIAAHTSSVAEYQERAADVLAAIEEGIIVPSIWNTYPLADAALAHEALESGKSSGAIILVP